MTYRYVCDLCSQELTGDSIDGLVELVQHHFSSDHGLWRETDVQTPNIGLGEDEIRSRIEEVDSDTT